MNYFEDYHSAVASLGLDVSEIKHVDEASSNGLKAAFKSNSTGEFLILISRLRNEGKLLCNGQLIFPSSSGKWIFKSEKTFLPDLFMINILQLFFHFFICARHFF